MVQSIEAELLEHVHFDCVEQLAAQAEEVVEEIVKVQQMVWSFQDKVRPLEQPELAPRT